MASDISSWNLNLLAAVGLGGFAALAYLVARIRFRRAELSLIDALILVATMAIVTAAGIPLFDYAGERAKATSLAQTLRTLRVQIGLYEVDHDGEVPLLYDGSLPQMCQATDSKGMPGPPGKQHPFGPYFPYGIPANPYNGLSYISPTEDFPPQSAPCVGGWLYHQDTGQIAPDLKDYSGEEPP